MLGGGAVLGAVEVGFIQRFEELGIKIDFVVGTSVGANNAAYLAFHNESGYVCFRDIWVEPSRPEAVPFVGRSMWHATSARPNEPL